MDPSLSPMHPSGQEPHPAMSRTRPAPVGRRSGGLRFRLRTSGIEAAARLGFSLTAIGLSRLLCAGLDLFSPATSAAARRDAWRQRNASVLDRREVADAENGLASPTGVEPSRP